jgi:hypothetical protein
MKSIKWILLLSAVVIVSCKAQRIVPLDYNYHDLDDISQLYFKDINDDMLAFEGIWIFESDTEKFVLTLEREEQFDLEEYGKRDRLVGNYSYIKNGLESIILTLIRISLLESN